VKTDSSVERWRGERSVVSTPVDFEVEVLAEHEWWVLRDLRLTALKDYPAAFLSSYEREEAYGERRWRQEFVRGEWNVIRAGERRAGLLGVTRLPDMPLQECYLEYMWVDPGFRRLGVASNLLRTVLDRLRDLGVDTVLLYILAGNDDAKRLYEKFGFQHTNEWQELPGHPAGREEKMRLRLH
jgi:ribosomal protein S18 acetylase RimI-like enzyme